MLCSKKKTQNYIPKEVKNLKKNPTFSHFTNSDLIAFYHQFKVISKGKINLSKIQFTEMLNTFNVILKSCFQIKKWLIEFFE